MNSKLIWKSLLATLALLAGVLTAASMPAGAQGSRLTVAEASDLSELVDATDYTAAHGDVLRLYRAFFDREPDISGAKYWIDTNQNGQTLDQIADYFTQSQEFANNYNGTSNSQYMAAVYTNVLGRDFDQSGFDYWLGLLSDGDLTRGGVVRWIAANDEFIQRFPYTPTNSGGGDGGGGGGDGGDATGTVVVLGCDKQEEVVVLQNIGTEAVELTGWTLYDQGPEHTLDLSGVTMAADEVLQITSGPNAAPNSQGVLFWKNNHVWNNEGDTAYLAKDGVEVSKSAC